MGCRSDLELLLPPGIMTVSVRILPDGMMHIINSLHFSRLQNPLLRSIDLQNAHTASDLQQQWPQRTIPFLSFPHPQTMILRPSTPIPNSTPPQLASARGCNPPRTYRPRTPPPEDPPTTRSDRPKTTSTNKAKTRTVRPCSQPTRQPNTAAMLRRRNIWPP